MYIFSVTHVTFCDTAVFIFVAHFTRLILCIFKMPLYTVSQKNAHFLF